jgi:cytochrome c2
LQSGYRVHQTNCAKCHAFEDPARHEIGKLTRKIIPAMAGKAKLGAAEQQAVLAYLLAARQVPPHPAP